MVRHMHAGLGAFLFVTSVVIILHFAAMSWVKRSPESQAAQAFGLMVA